MQPLHPASALDATRDQRLWQVAKARTKFQGHLVVYLLVNAGLWALWAITDGTIERHSHHDMVPWPIWSTLFWGLGLAIQGFSAYSKLNRGERIQREYERLLKQAQY